MKGRTSSSNDCRGGCLEKKFSKNVSTASFVSGNEALDSEGGELPSA